MSTVPCRQYTAAGALKLGREEGFRKTHNQQRRVSGKPTTLCPSQLQRTLSECLQRANHCTARLANLDRTIFMNTL
jgi:hypothetical protein